MAKAAINAVENFFIDSRLLRVPLECGTRRRRLSGGCQEVVKTGRVDSIRPGPSIP